MIFRSYFKKLSIKFFLHSQILKIILKNRKFIYAFRTKKEKYIEIITKFIQGYLIKRVFETQFWKSNPPNDENIGNYEYISTLILQIYRKYRRNIVEYFFTNINGAKMI